MKQELQMRLAVAKFMQDALQEMANKKNSEDGDAKEVTPFLYYICNILTDITLYI